MESINPDNYTKVNCNSMVKFIYVIRKTIIVLSEMIPIMETYTIDLISNIMKTATRSNEEISFDEGNLESFKGNRVITIDDKDRYIILLQNVIKNPTDLESLMFINEIMNELLVNTKTLRRYTTDLFVNDLGNITETKIDIDSYNQKCIANYDRKLDSLYESFKIYDVIITRLYWSFKFKHSSMKNYYKLIQKLFWIHMEISSAINTSDDNRVYDYNILFIRNDIYNSSKLVKMMVYHEFLLFKQILNKEDYELMSDPESSDSEKL